MNMEPKKKIISYTWLILGIIFLIIFIIGTTYAFFQFTRTGATNTIETGYVSFDFVETKSINLTNQFPIEESEIDSRNECTFTITAHTTLTKGLTYNIYAVYGDEMVGKTRIDDSVIKMKLTPPADGDGFTITNNYYATAKAPEYTNGKVLLATGTVKNTQALTTKNYSLKLWVDADKIFVSSTTKRAINAEGNPSLADSTTGTVTATRYMKNDTSDPTTVTLYPAKTEQVGKIIYTTNEFSGKYYSVKILVEAVDTK